MTTAGQIDVKLGLNSDEFIKSFVKADDTLKELEKNLKNSKTDFENVSKAMAGTKNPSKELVNLFEQLKSKLKEDQSALNSFQNKLKGLQGNLLGETNPAVDMLSGALKKLAGPAVAVAVGKKLIDLGRDAVDTAAKFESLAVSFEVLTGGAEAGQKLTNQIIDLAAKTPLTTEALTDGVRTLLSFGESADEVVKDLRLLGDITGGDAQKMQSLTLAFAQVGSTGRLMGQDLLQMINAGFNPLSIMSEKTGKSMKVLKDEMAAGKITFNDVKQAMIDATSEGGRFNGMMEKQSQTLQGLKSTNQDTWKQVSKAIGDFFLPAAKAVQRAFIAIGNACLNAIDKLKKFNANLRVETPEAMKKMSEGFAKDAEKLYKLADEYDKKGNKQWAESYRKKAAEYERVSKSYLTKAEETLKKEQEIYAQGKTKGFSALSSVGTSGESPAVKAAKKQKDDLLAISKSYAQEMANIESLETAKNELGENGGRFQYNYSEKLKILQWYYNERKRIMDVANNDMDLAQEQFNKLEELKTQKMLQANIIDWTNWGESVKGVLGNSLNTLLTTTDNFGDAMINVMSMIYQSLIKMALDAALKEIEITQIKTAIITALNAMTGGIGGTIAGIGGKISGLFGKTAKFHSGGLSTSEQLAVIRKDERVLNPAETTAYNSGQGGESTNGVNNIMMFNIKAWDGKDVINTLKSNSQTINQIVASGIKNNNQGLRTTVQNT